MAKILIHSDSASSATSVSNIFIDEYMSDANGEFVKIYLYLLRLMNAPDSAFSISSIADKFEHTEKDVKRALSYWERMHLLRLEYDTEHNLTGICLIDSASRDKTGTGDDFPENETAAETPEADSVSSLEDTYHSPDDGISSVNTESFPPKRDYTRDELKQFQENDQIAELLFVAERYLVLATVPTTPATMRISGLYFFALIVTFFILAFTDVTIVSLFISLYLLFKINWCTNCSYAIL